MLIAQVISGAPNTSDSASSPKTRWDPSAWPWMRSSEPCSWNFFFFKQTTAYEISECDWSSDVCSSDLMWINDVHSARRWDGHDPTSTVIHMRSEERRVGKECRIGCRSRWSPDH